MDPVSLAASTVTGILGPSHVFSLLSNTTREFKEVPLILRQIQDELGLLQRNIQITCRDHSTNTSTVIPLNLSLSLHPLPMQDLARLYQYAREYMPLIQTSQNSSLKLRGTRQATVWNSVRKDKDLPNLKDSVASYNQFLSTYTRTQW
jgi:hypothetical protein